MADKDIYITKGEISGPQFAGNPDEIVVDPYTLKPIRRDDPRWGGQFDKKPSTGGSMGNMPSSPMPKGGGMGDMVNPKSPAGEMGALHMDENPMKPDYDPRPWMGDDMQYEENRKKIREGRR